jgi:hypothetical protein
VGLAGRLATLSAVLATALAMVTVALASASVKDARISGRVLVCNAPGHCMQRQFQVSATNAHGKTVARTTTTDAYNDYTLRLAPGSYNLVATSDGLTCKASAKAVAHHTTHKNITCLVP